MQGGDLALDPILPHRIAKRALAIVRTTSSGRYWIIVPRASMTTAANDNAIAR